MDNGTTQAAPSGGSLAWARAFAVLYDPFVWVGERAGMRGHRKELLSRARGCTLEIGSGTGLNLPHYPDDLDELVLAEPDAAMRSALKRGWAAAVGGRGWLTRRRSGCRSPTDRSIRLSRPWCCVRSTPRISPCRR